MSTTDARTTPLPADTAACLSPHRHAWQGLRRPAREGQDFRRKPSTALPAWCPPVCVPLALVRDLTSPRPQGHVQQGLLKLPDPGQEVKTRGGSGGPAGCGLPSLTSTGTWPFCPFSHSAPPPRGVRSAQDAASPVRVTSHIGERAGEVDEPAEAADEVNAHEGVLHSTASREHRPGHRGPGRWAEGTA